VPKKTATISPRTIRINDELCIFFKVDLLQWGELQFTTDGENWQALACEQDGELIKATNIKETVKAVRFLNKSGKPQEFYLRKFTLGL
jgi:hypothetical protein